MRRVKLELAVLFHFRGPRLTSRLRQIVVRLRNPLADIRFGRGCRLGPGFSISAPWGGTFVCGDGCEFRRGFRAELEGPQSTIAIGEACVFTYYTLVQCGRSIAIGDRVLLAQSSMVVDGSHRFRELDRPVGEQGYDFRPVRIADDAAVMAKSTIIADIGERSFVGANSVVTREVPPYSVVVGAPAKVIDSFGP